MLIIRTTLPIIDKSISVKLLYGIIFDTENTVFATNTTVPKYKSKSLLLILFILNFPVNIFLHHSFSIFYKNI